MKEYCDRLLGIANKVRLLGSEFPDSRLVQKILVTVPERFEATIASLENTKDLSKMSLAELIQALQSQEQRRLMRSDEGFVEGTLAAGTQSNNFQQKVAMQENLQQRNVAQVVDRDEEEQLFAFAVSHSNEKWIIDSGCTNHMTFDRDLFKELDT